jgi:N-acetylmuramoyl-L-alanine amidase
MRLSWLALVFIMWGGSLRAELVTVTLRGQEYVTLESLGPNFGLGTPVKSGTNEFALTGEGRSLAVKANSRQALINGVRHWLSFPTQAYGTSAAVSRVDAEKTIRPAMKPSSVQGFRPVTTVVLDPGHGGHDRGAKSSLGYEKDFALDVVNRVRKGLEKAGLKVVQSRLGDTFIPLEARPAMARKYPSPIFVSIHFNSADWNPAANGLEIFAISPLGVPPTGQALPQARDRMKEAGHALEPVNLVLANTIYHALLGKTSSFDRGVKRARFVVLKEATVPAVLIEGGFLTNATEAAKVASPAWRQTYADAIVAGILEYKKLAEGGVTPKKVTEYGRAGTTGFVQE